MKKESLHIRISPERLAFFLQVLREEYKIGVFSKQEVIELSFILLESFLLRENNRSNPFPFKTEEEVLSYIEENIINKTRGTK